MGIFTKRERRQSVPPDYGIVHVTTQFEVAPLPFDQNHLASLPETESLVEGFDVSDDHHLAALRDARSFLPI